MLPRLALYSADLTKFRVLEEAFSTHVILIQILEDIPLNED